MLIEPDEVIQILQKFHRCAPVFIALGDEARQKLILSIANAGKMGLNVTDLSATSNLSRPAISHHLKVLKDSGLVIPNKIGTQIFYKLNLKENFEEIEKLLDSIKTTLLEIEKKEKELL